MEAKSKICPDHPKNKILFACFDEQCPSNALACVICVKKQHKTCSDQSLMSISELSDVKINKLDIENAKTRLSGLYKEKVEDFMKSFNELEKYYFAFLDIKSLDENSTETEIQSIRNMSKVVVNDGKVSLEVLDSIKPENLSQLLTKFATKLDRNFNKFSKELKKIRLRSLSSVAISDFTFHDSIKSKLHADGVEFYTDNINMDYYSVFFTTPETKGSYSIEIKNINQNERWLDMGIMKSSVFQTHKDSKKTGWYVADTWVFGGTSVQSVQGTGVKESYSDENGIANGKIYTIDFDAESESVRITSKDGLVDYKGKIPKDDTFHFYFVLYYSNMRVVVRKN